MFSQNLILLSFLIDFWKCVIILHMTFRNITSKSLIEIYDFKSLRIRYYHTTYQVNGLHVILWLLFFDFRFGKQFIIRITSQKWSFSLFRSENRFFGVFLMINCMLLVSQTCFLFFYQLPIMFMYNFHVTDIPMNP